MVRYVLLQKMSIATRALLFWALCCLGFACSTDFEVNAPYTKIPVVNGFLNPAERVQYVRVQRTFQNRSGDASVIARNNRDSSEFRPGEIQVSLWRVTPTEVKIGNYQPIESSTKDTNGSFYGPDQTLFRLDLGGTNVLIPGQVYKLKIKNLVTGDSSVQAVTNIVGPFNIIAPTNDRNIAPRDTLALKTIYIQPQDGNEFNLQYFPSCYARLTSMNMRINYRDIKTDGTTEDHDIWFKQAISVVESSVGSQCGRNDRPNPKPIAVKSRPIFQAMMDSIPAADNTIAFRNFINVQCYFYAASQQVADYQNTNLQFLPITQSVPTYSNIAGGVGVFASVRSEIVTAVLQPNLANELNSRNAAGLPIYPKLEALKFRNR